VSSLLVALTVVVCLCVGVTPAEYCASDKKAGQCLSAIIHSVINRLASSHATATITGAAAAAAADDDDDDVWFV